MTTLVRHMYAVIAYDPHEPADTLGFLSSIEREGKARIFSTPDAAEEGALDAEDRHDSPIEWMIVDLGHLENVDPDKVEDLGSSEGIVA